MNQCVISVTPDGERWTHRCLTCGWERTLDSPHYSLGRQCSSMESYGDVLATFDTPGKRAKLASGRWVYRHQLYNVTQADFDSAEFPAHAVKADGSAVGSRLRTLFAKLGFGDKPGCSCTAVKNFLDAVDLEYVQSRHAALVKLIADSAAHINVTVPNAAVSAALTLAVWLEKWRLHNAKQNE